MSIPKIIHWCWVGPDKPPVFIENCIKTWRKHMPDYEIRLWDRYSFNFNSVPWVKEAFEARKWAYVADYIRVYALYHFGGIYLDSDVKVYKSFDPFLRDKCFIGQDIGSDGKVYGPEAAIMGSIAHFNFLKEVLDYYNTSHFVDQEGNPVEILMPKVLGKILEKYGYKYDDKDQKLMHGINIYSSIYFCNWMSHKYRKMNFAYHINTKTWTMTNRGRFYSFCWNHSLMPLYRFVERLYLKYRRMIGNN